MQEFERQQYLTLMGIQSWMPRQPLPYAPLPNYIAMFDPKLLDQELLDQQAFAKSASETAVAVPTKKTNTARLLPETEIIAATQSLEPIETPQPVNINDKDFSITFEQVQFWQFSFLIWEDKLLCFQSLQQADAAKLAQAILGALTGHYEHHLAQHQWPLFVEEPLESAKTRLSIFMKTLRAKVKVILCFGTLEPQVFRPVLGCTWLAEHQRCISLPSLTAMLADASQKAVAWKHLKPLFFDN